MTLDLGRLRAALLRAGLRDDDDLGDAALHCVQRIRRGNDLALACWLAVRDVRRGRSPITQADYRTWGASTTRGTGRYTLSDGRAVKYADIDPSHWVGEESREIDPAVMVSILGGGAE